MLIGPGEEHKGLYVAKDDLPIRVHKMDGVGNAELWHRRLGHPSMRVVEEISQTNGSIEVGKGHEYCDHTVIPNIPIPTISRGEQATTGNEEWEGHVAANPSIQPIRRGNRIRRPNRKYVDGEATRFKEIQADFKKMIDLMEKRHEEYTTQRSEHTAKIARLEAALANSSGREGQLIHPPFQVRNVKLDFPRFDRTEVMQWLFKAEQFFDYYGTPDAQGITIAAVHLDKGVVPWFQIHTRGKPFITWASFRSALELEFGPSPFDCPRANLFKLTQSTTVADFYMEFTTLANQIQGLSAEALLDCFISGHRNDIRRDVVAQSPQSLAKAVSLAKLFEEKYVSIPVSKPYTPASFPRSTTPLATTKSPLPPLLPTPSKPITATSKQPSIKRISPAEMQIRREKGLCYTCDEKFSLGHKCPNRQMLLLMGDDEDIHFITTTHSSDPPFIEEPPVSFPPPDHHLSFNAIRGYQSKGTLRFTGYINGMELQILLDSGSSDNFFQPRLAHCLKLPIQPSPNFKVMVGNGNNLTAEGFVDNLHVVIQGHRLHVPVYLLPITGAELVRGASWLATLGPRIADFNALSMKFYHDNSFVTLYGNNVSLPQPAQYHHIQRMHTTGALAESYQILFFCFVSDPMVHKSDDSEFNAELQTLLTEFQDVFATPSGLPPTRSHDHAIPLLDGSNPIKVRPYRYAHSQKNQIEVMVHEMLQQGIIQPSSSPFSSPVLLLFFASMTISSIVHL
ncbi:uncharacterized protein LOC112516745 [Cynara cardunculus var. scolymus]|uniref:uncharacterized protein LOC112516745 n=1 Tax=Cynara cardunculus var. scolymus TaxID=59895 RepID=UPI000D631130|nr:uncharacterized protein LOC112516745 [Cynara cardunculus var. scolymus]